jgi:hypothetical protein
MADNWKHRSQGMRCDTCYFYVPKGETRLGRCRRRAPTLNGWPAVYDSDWCGDHKLDENKIFNFAPPTAQEEPLRSRGKR